MRGSEFKQTQIHIFRFLALLHDVILDDVPVSSFTDSRGIIAVRPKLAAPQFFAEIGMPFEELFGGDAFVQTHGLADAVFRMEGGEEVYVVEIGSQLLYFKIISFFDILADVVERTFDLVLEQRFSVFDGKYDVVVSLVDAMVASFECHAHIVAYPCSVVQEPQVPAPSEKVPVGASTHATGYG